MAEKTARKQRGKPWVAGQSGNSKGRPVGARNQATVVAEMLLDGEAEALTRKAIEAALAGNVIALRLCLERILPPRRERPLAFRLSPKPSQVYQVLIKGLSSGKLLPAEASAIVGVLDAERKAKEAIEFEERLVAIEQVVTRQRRRPPGDRILR